MLFGTLGAPMQQEQNLGSQEIKNCSNEASKTDV